MTPETLDTAFKAAKAAVATWDLRGWHVLAVAIVANLVGVILHI